jgi:DNA-binding transcriptional LysR family regulator
MDRLTGMRTFVNAVDLGSFRRAAEAGRISATMVAKHIAALEQHLGGQLLVKTTRRQGLTLLGEAFYERCLRIIDEVAQADALAEHMLQQPKGMLRVTAPPTFGNLVLSPLIVDFLQRYRDISIDLVLTDRKVDFIEEGFEIGFRIGSIDDDALVARRLPPYRLKLAASPIYVAAAGIPLVPEDLAAHEIIGFRQWEARRFWRLQRDGEAIEIPLQPRLLVNDAEAARRAAVGGFGIVLHSAQMLADDLDAGRLVEVLPEFTPPSQPVHMLYMSDRRRPEKVLSFIRFVLARLATGTGARQA